MLSQRCEQGLERPVAFASRTLSPAEKSYAQLEKEGLAIVFGVKKFHQYLFGRTFQILSDHKPLQHLFSETRPVPPLASSRIQRWALTLSAYNYTITYKPGAEQASADSLSRLPLPQVPQEVPIPEEIVFLMQTLQGSPVTATHIKKWTDQDPVLSRVRYMVLHGWRDSMEEEFTPFNRRHTELSVQDGCVLWGSRVVVPRQGRKQILEELHDSHPGVTRMKSIARGVVWWPGIDQDLEEEVKHCQQCQTNQASPARIPLHPWEWPDRPWARVHVDHAGPFLGKHFLVVVDAYSKWLIVTVVPALTSQCTIRHLREIFATHGLPELLVSDNGTAFTSSEFKEFMVRNGIRHVTTAPYHPSSNGLAERAVRTFKEGMKKYTLGEIETRLARFLFHYRTTPHSTTGRSPAELLMGRCLRSPLDLIQPDAAEKVRQKQDQQKQNYDQHTKDRPVKLGDAVFARNFGCGPRWLPGKVATIQGSSMVLIQLQSDGRTVRRHLDQI